MFKLAPLPRTLPAALRDIDDKKLEVRISTVRDLGRHAAEGEARAVEALSRALCGDAAAAVRSEAAVALADAKAPGAEPALISALEDGSPRVRQMALLALGEVAEPEHAEALAAIRDALREDSPELRFQALIALYQVAGDDALPDVFEHMSDEDPEIRHVAFRIAEERHFEREPGSMPAELRRRAERALEDEAPQVRLVAAVLLARAGDDSGQDIIVSAINARGTGADPEDEHAAIELAGERGYEGARPGLARRAWGGLLGGRDPFAWQARVALARMGEERARDEILRGLGAWSRDSRTLAVAAAGRARLSAARPVLEAMRGDERRADPAAVDEALELLSRP